MPPPPRQQQQQQQRRDTIPQGQKRRAASSLHEIDQDSQHNRPSKKQKLHYPAYFPPRFWDGLSRVKEVKEAKASDLTEMQDSAKKTIVSNPNTSA
ncbi:hypothetical protein E4U54_004403 [Claviceps lovelessii]|nr:hypothetical protein E4U54_004403 [Claviceps lovelessii]